MIVAQVGPPVATIGRLVELRELRHRWVAAYGESVRPQLVAGQYCWLDLTPMRTGWQQVPLPTSTYWGASRQLTFCWTATCCRRTLSLLRHAGELMRTMRLVPYPAGAVQVLVPPAGV